VVVQKIIKSGERN